MAKATQEASLKVLEGMDKKMVGLDKKMDTVYSTVIDALKGK